MVKRTQLAVYLLIVAVFMIGMWRVETTANRAKNTAHRLDAEIERDADQSCRIALATRAEAEQNLVNIAIELGAEPDTVATIHRQYDALPPPADC